MAWDGRALDRLAELDAAVTAAKQTARGLARDIDAARAEVNRIGAERVEAFSRNDEDAVESAVRPTQPRGPGP